MRVLTEHREGVDLVVVNYKTPSDLKAFAASLLHYEVNTPFTLFVMNNDPELSDLKAAKLVEDLIPGTVVMNNPNIYYSGACNQGVAAGDREVVALLNADTRFLDGSVDKCYEAIKANPNWGALGPLQVDDQKRVTHAGIFGTLDHPSHRGWKSRSSIQYEDVREAVTLSGSAIFTTREAWDELTQCPVYRQAYPHVSGAFLPTTHYYEETWYCYHLHAHGYKPTYFGQAKMIHRWHKASPVGGWADKQFKPSQKMFREMCDLHGVDHD